VAALGVRPLKLGGTGPDVRLMQVEIAKEHPAVNAEGVFDEVTKGALEDLQLDYGLPQTGVADSTTQKLFQARETGFASAVLDSPG
jgi:peptidoglycan hydrolase-like protein with peptidoglycan-binding domain